MDFNLKALPWVENICQKFENMCQEVEGIVCKEVKHVEDQVQTVGANVKKFCSGVVQDFLPPSPKESDCDACMEEDPINDNPSDEELEIIASTGKFSPSISTSNGIYDKSNLLPPSFTSPGEGAGLDSSLDGNSSSTHKGYDTDTHEDNTKDKTPVPKFSKETSSGVPAEQSGFCGFDLSLEESGDSEMCQKSGKDGVEIHTSEKPPSPDVIEVACSEKDSSQSLSFHSLTNENEEKVEDKLEGVEDVPSSVFSEEGTSYATFIDSPECVEDVPSSVFSEEGVSYAAVTGSPECVTDCLSSLQSHERADLVHSGLSYQNKSDDTGLPPSSRILSVKSDGLETSLTSNASAVMGSSSYWIKHNSEHVESESFTCTSQVVDGNAELVKCNVGFEPVVNMNEFDDVKLGDSCMVVDSKEIPSISSRARNHRSYKKKIRDALASRVRSSKQREYEQLSILHGDLDSAITEVRTEGSLPSMLTRHVVSKDLPIYDSYESDWELL